MGDWRKDQSKNARRYVWGETRGEKDAMWRDFAARMKAFPDFGSLRIEKIGAEIHAWRPLQEESGKMYWTSCMRFTDDGWGYWSVMFRTDERRWRASPIKDQPLGRALEQAAEFYKQHLFS